MSTTNINSDKHIQDDNLDHSHTPLKNCRICYEVLDKEIVKLPCMCKGEMSQLHKECFQKWLGYSSTNKTLDQQGYTQVQCQICKTTIKFTREEEKQCNRSLRKCQKKCAFLVFTVFFIIFAANSIFFLKSSTQEGNKRRFYIGISMALIALFFLVFVIKGTIQHCCIIINQRIEFISTTSPSIN